MPAATALAVGARGLAEHFGSTRAVDGVDLLVPEGSVHGLRPVHDAPAGCRGGSASTR